ncbi:DUF6544 family protein [Spongiivirga citrea]|uniref:Uncharacterized protein n=1 Tax=Spongiivirga citrea TaxID=1481457 RepID=A0A6M0CKT8_9FLAO|nr:DUF6544 family protein [Spongiivirga citrea]NER16594.1 hypothetical protein [Spongiivirga citrea]
MKYVFSFLVLLHGLIHFMGFAKAFHFAKIEQLTKDISKPTGVLWLITGVLFIVAMLLYLFKNDFWAVLAILATIVSQIIIFFFWKDAKFGTIANFIILVVSIISWATTNFENSYKKDVVIAMSSIPKEVELITTKDLQHLPVSVKKYLNYVGVVDQPKVYNFKIVFEGEMREKGKDWFLFTSEQYNFIETPTRLFFMKGKVSGLPTNGYHKYLKNEASMTIKVLSLFPVVKIDSPELFQTETVTYFNDLCLFAPASLINKNIQWEEINERSAKAIFTSNGITISAILHFNEKGQLINFVSNDRSAVSGMKPIPFSTPAKEYKRINGLLIPTYGETIWHYPEADFTYGKFYLKTIEFNTVQ